MPKRTIEQLVDDQGYDDDVKPAVLEDISRHGTADRILDGSLRLPTPEDARMWHDRVTGRAAQTATERTQADELASLKQRLEALESQRVPQTPTTMNEGQ